MLNIYLDLPKLGYWLRYAIWHVNGRLSIEESNQVQIALDKIAENIM